MHTLSRRETPDFDLADEASVQRAAAALRPLAPLHLVVIATGVLHLDGRAPEKRLADLDAAALARILAVNAIGPALLIKHLHDLLPTQGRSLLAVLSARVGSIGDNRLGGWYAYRASKAALNQLLVTAAIELQRRRPEAICLALHPGTVDTSLSQPFAKDGLDLQSPLDAARRLLDVIDKATPQQTGSFLDHHGIPIPW